MIEVRDLVIEVTRRCNMRCPHCLRGDVQNLDILLDYVDTLFSKIDTISTLTITGGEPSLVPEIINSILDSANKHQVEIGSFYIATNAKKITMEFIHVLLRMWQECGNEFYYDDDIAMVQYSNDIYHDFEDVDREGLRLLQALKFVSPRNKSDDAEYMLIAEGKAPDNYECKKTVTPDEFIIESSDGDNIIIENGTLYLNAKGFMIAGCDFSYENQDDPEHGCQICHVNDFTPNKMLDFLAELV